MRVAEAGRPVTTRAVLAALVLGIAPITLVRWLLPTATELPQVEIWKPLDIPIAAAALGLWLFAVVSLRLPRIPPRVCRPLALALAAAPTLLSALCLPTTVSNDERAYILQAEMLAAGRLSLPLVEPREALRRRQIHEDPERRRLYSKYPPGTAAALAPGARLGLPAVMVLAAGLLDLLLIAALARQLGLADPWLAALLLASCPLFLLLQTSFQSQVFTLPAALAGYLALLRAREQNGRRFGWGAAAGACSGWIFLTRPLTGLVFAAAMLPGLLVRGPETRAPGLRAVSGAVLGGLPFLALLLLYNRSLTGDALQTPYGAYAAAFSPWDVYPLFRSDYIHAPATAFFQSLFQQLGRWLPALFGILGAAGLGAWGLWRLRRSDGGAGLALLLLLPLAYAFHWYPGHWAYLGPIYGFEALGLMIVAALVLLEDAPEGWSRSLAPLAVAAGVALSVYRFPFIQAEAEQRAAPRTAAVAAGLPEGAVVLLPWFHNPERQERSRMRYTPSRPPFSDVSEIVYLRELGRAAHTRAALDTLGLADRPIFRFLPGLVEGSGHLLPYSR